MLLSYYIFLLKIFLQNSRSQPHYFITNQPDRMKNSDKIPQPDQKIQPKSLLSRWLLWANMFRFIALVNSQEYSKVWLFSRVCPIDAETEIILIIVIV